MKYVKTVYIIEPVQWGRSGQESGGRRRIKSKLENIQG